MSSGTTSGNKYLPVTKDAIRANRRAGALLLAFLARRGGVENLAAGRFLYLGGCTTLTPRGRCLHGDASGIMARHIPLCVRGRHLPPRDIGEISNWEAKIDRIVERYLTADVCCLAACPSWAAMLFRHMRAAAEDKGLPGEIGRLWPKLSHFVSYGMAFEPYRPAFERYIGRDVHYVDTYSSSEAGMSGIQDSPGGPMRLLIDNGVFYEFIPAGRADDPDPPRLHMGEVECGVDYAVVVNANGGIWSYPIGDVVRFESLAPPRIAFAGRTQLQLSAFGEHVTGEMIEAAVADAGRATGAIVTDYTIAARYPSPRHPKPAHRWLVEFETPPTDLAAWMTAADQSIRTVNEDYDTHRTDDYGMDPPTLVPVAAGAFYEWMKSKGKLGGQHKVPRVARGDEMESELLAISERLSG
jgi:hypothetical protein